MGEDNTVEPMRMVVVGSGGVGIWLTSGLARMLEFRAPGSVLVIVDGDHFEPRNAERQHFTDLGNKAEVRVKELQPMFPNTFIVADPRWVVAESDAEAEDLDSPAVAASTLLNDNDVVFTAVDNFAARKVIFDAAKQLDNIHVFHGGNDDALFGSTYHYARKDGVELIDHPADYHPELIDPPDRNPGEMSCQERAELEGATQTLAANMMVAATLLSRVHVTIFEGEQDEHSEIFFDMAVGLAQPYDRAATPTEDEEPVEAEVGELESV